jgi:hypothetical protein
MIYRNWILPKSKVYDAKNRKRKSKGNRKNKDEMKAAFKDEEELKRKKKRLTIDWFFRPKDD